MENTTMHVLFNLSQFAGLAFVSGLWEGLAMVAAVALCLRLLPGLSASVRFAVWASAFALLASLPLLHVHTGKSLPQTSYALVHAGSTWGAVIAAIWAAMTVFRLSQLLAASLYMRRVWRRAIPVAAYGEFAASMQHGRRNAVLCTSTDVDSPSVIGFIWPRLLIPEWMIEHLTAPELRQVVLHECEHLRRRDDWIGLMQRLVLALFPLNPALLWLDGRLSLERELACDAGVVASMNAPFDYAHCLTRLAEHRMVRRRVALALSAWDRRPELATRVHSLLRPVQAQSPFRARVSAALVALALAAASAGMMQMPRLVAFDAPANHILDEAAVPPRPAAVPAAQPIPMALQPHPKFMQASLALPRSSRHRPNDESGASHQSPRELPVVNASANRRLPHIVLTTMRKPATKANAVPTNRSPVRPVYAVETVVFPSYAAIPFGNGWLLVRL